MQTCYAIRNTHRPLFWSAAFGWTDIWAADKFQKPPTELPPDGEVSEMLWGSTSQWVYDEQELRNTIHAIQQYNKYLKDEPADSLRKLIHKNMLLLERENASYCSLAGFVLTRYKGSDGIFRFKISVSASLFSAASS